MQRLRDRDQVHAFVSKAAIFSWSDFVFNFWMWSGSGDLLRAAVGSDDFFEALGEVNGGLTVAAGAIPGDIFCRNDTREIREEFLWIMRAERGVAGGDGGEVIAELTHFLN